MFLLTNLMVMVYVHGFFENKLPKPAPESVEWFKFSEERALIHLQKLASFGVRSVGSYSNEVLTPNYILEFIEDLIESVNENANKYENVNRVEVDTQKVSGSFALEHFLGGFVNVYSNISNVLVRVSNPKRPETLSSAILVSSHYDSALGCSGMSDDGINVAIMMEMLRNLMVTQKELEYAVILNFNGGEETILQAAHGFITRHRWRESVKLFLNLEASGLSLFGGL